MTYRAKNPRRSGRLGKQESALPQLDLPTSWPPAPSPGMTAIDLMRDWLAARREGRWLDAAGIMKQLEHMARRPPEGKLFRLKSLAGGLNNDVP